METLYKSIEFAATLIECVAVSLMLGLIIFGTIRWTFFAKDRMKSSYDRYRMVLGKSMLIGLELLVAADIIRTVALELTMYNIATLATLVLVRTFLSWTLSVEVEGHWPWRETPKSESRIEENMN